MAKTSGTIDLKSIKQAATGAVGYITDISDNGVFVHKKSSSAVIPTSSNANGVQITSNVDIIRGGESVAQYGSDARIGKVDEGRLMITSSDVIVYGKKNKKALSFGSTNNSDGVATVTEYLKVFEASISGIGEHVGTSLTYTPISITHCYKNNNETTDISMTLINEDNFNFAYNDSALVQGDYIEITYRTSDQISYLELGYSSVAFGANSMAIGDNSISSGSNSLTVGYGSKAIGRNSVSFGEQNQTFAENSFSSGIHNVIKGEDGTALGVQNTVTGDGAFAAGIDNVASGGYSTALGNGTIANGWGALACGQYNIQNSGVMFAVGNGEDSDNRSDAFWVSGSGNIGFTGIAYAGQPSGADRVPLFATGTGTAQITINGNTTSPTAQSINIAKTGYTPWAINGIDITSPSCNLYRYFIDGNKLYYRLYNTSSSSVTVTITARISYIATSALSSS